MMKKILGKRFLLPLTALFFVFLYSCDKDDDNVSDTGRSAEFQLSAVNNSDVDGKVTISENADKSFNVLVTVDNSVKDTVHTLHIHNGSIANPGSIAVPLTSITGTGGSAQSLTSNINSVTLPDSSVHPFTYDSVLKFDGYVNIHYSAGRMDSLISQGNIGISN